ncbi:MAG TPA: OsmC family protein [Candidatus Limnocylindrales bacterium]
MSEGNARLEQEQNYRFRITFPGMEATVRSDLPPPTGGGTGPSPEHLLAAAVGNCLSASLLFALRKFKQAPDPIRTTAEPKVGRNAAGRLRVESIAVRIDLGAPAGSLEHLDRVLATFEDFCTVTASVRGAIAVDVQVYDRDGVRLK